MLQHAGVVKIPDTFTNEESADIYFVFGFCRGNVRDAHVE